VSSALLTVMLGCPTNLIPNFDLDVILALPKYPSSSLLSARQLFEKEFIQSFCSQVHCYLISGERKRNKRFTDLLRYCPA